MKIRTDFVTNSSSSSFILARGSELTEKQKQVIIDYVESNMLGDKILTPDNTEEEINKILEDFYIEEEREIEVRKALKSGKTVYYGAVCFENCEYNYADMLISLWEQLEATGDAGFEAIDSSLDY